MKGFDGHNYEFCAGGADMLRGWYRVARNGDYVSWDSGATAVGRPPLTQNEIDRAEGGFPLGERYMDPTG